MTQPTIEHKKWKSNGLLIPVTHEPGKQKGFGMSGKGGGEPKSFCASKGHKSCKYWVKMENGKLVGSAAVKMNPPLGPMKGKMP